MNNNKSSMPVWALALVVLGVVGFYVFGGAGLIATSSDDLVETGNGNPTTDVAGDEPTGEIVARRSTLEPIRVGQLPPEAIDTLDLIFSGGPYPFDRDDTVFQNREGLLPDRERGYYREYTVITPGEDDRGARRIVAGADGDLYYTSDHYQSFNEIVGDVVGARS